MLTFLVICTCCNATQLKGWGGVGHVNVPCRERRKELADSSFDMLSLSRIEITILSVRCTSTWI